MSEINDNSNDKKIVFKKNSRFRQRRQKLDDNEDESQLAEECGEDWIKLNELKQIQNQRKRSSKGINILELTQNPMNTNNSICNKNETKMGGLSDAKTLSSELDLGNTFSVETNRRDEDTDLMKYIDEELSKRKGRQVTSAKSSVEAAVNPSNDWHLFNVLPEHLIHNSSKKSEEMLSNQMLNGIPEIELGLEERIRNIEATEEAKQRLLDIQKKKSASSSGSSFVPNNIAVCFVHHNRYSNANEEIPHLTAGAKRLRPEPQPLSSAYVEEPVVVIGDEPKQMFKMQNKGSEGHQKGFHGKDKASDDYIFEKFKKQFRKF